MGSSGGRLGVVSHRSEPDIERLQHGTHPSESALVGLHQHPQLQVQLGLGWGERYQIGVGLGELAGEETRCQPLSHGLEVQLG